MAYKIAPRMAQVTIQQAFELAVRLHDAGKFQEAERLYREILVQQPTHFEAMHNLGLIAHQAGRNDIAADLIRRTLASNPDYAEGHVNLGTVLTDKGELDEAVASFRQAIALKPPLAEAHSSLGDALRKKNKLDEALAACQRAIDLKPAYAEAHNNLGNVLKELGRLDEAIAAYRWAIALKPDLAEGYSNLGNALWEKGRLDEAITACRRAIALKPRHAEAYCNLGNALKDSEQIDEAIAAYRQAIVLQPRQPEAFSNLGVALRMAEKLEESIGAFQQAIALNPQYAKAYSNLGGVWKDKGRLDEAIANYRRAIEIRPNYTEAHSNLIFTMHYHPSSDARSIAEESSQWNRRHGQPLAKNIQPFTNSRDPQRRLRIGYFSADFRHHASACFLLPLLKNHDRGLTELFCYAQVIRPDAMTNEFQKEADVWRSTVGISDDDVARQIREDRIDILVDLKMHTAENRLPVFARKPAPIQVAWLAYPGGTGLATMDFRLSDPYLDPPGMDDSVYTERTIRLPDTFWCYDSQKGRDLPVTPLPAAQRGTVTFGCLNNFCKTNDALFALWAQVLRQVQGSRMLLMAPEGDHRERTLNRFHQQGIDRRRIEFIARRSRREYLEIYHQMDVGLDTFPYNGHTTSLDSLWMGVPVVTMIGTTPVGRGGFSQLSNLGLADLAAKSQDEFVRLAVGLAKDLPRLQELRSTLRGRMERSPLMDGPRFARNMEAAYRQMWRGWCEARF